MKIGELLLEAQLVTEAQIDEALASASGMRLGSALIALRYVEPDAVARCLAQLLGVPPARSADLISPDPAALAIVPSALQQRIWALPYKVHGTGAVRVLEVAMRDPENRGAINVLGLAAGMKIDARVAPELLLKEALHPRTELPPSRGAAAPGDGAGGLELDLDKVGPPTGHGRRGAQAYQRSTRPPPAAAAPGTPGKPAELPLPPLKYDEGPDTAKTVSQVFKLVFGIAAIVAVVFVGLRFKKCMTSTTKAVKGHYDSKLLKLSIDFPPDNGWRVAPQQRVDMGAAKSEFFYRGGVPEAPVVSIVLARGPAEDVGTAANRALTDLIKDASMMTCDASPDRPGATVCKGGGKLTLFGRKRGFVQIDVHAWIIGTGELVMAVCINPDYTLSENQYILSSIVEIE